MKKIVIFLIFLLAYILRFYNLGKIPNSLDWDEASLGYNTYSILKTARDEYGNFLPLQFRSFGDFKPPLYVYFSVPLISVFGLSEFSVRLTSAIFGFLTVVVVYYLVTELFPSFKKRYLYLITFLVAISPWQIQFSRVAFEANVGLFFFILGTYLFVKIPKNIKYIFPSVFIFILSMYTYHSLRLIAPVFMLGLFVIYFKEAIKYKKALILTVIIAFILLLPLSKLLDEGVRARFSSVTSVNPESLSSSIKQMELDIQRGDMLGKFLHNRRLVYALSVIKGYFDHWDLLFLFREGDGPDRHHAPDMGMLYFIELPFVLLGLFYLLFSRLNLYGKKVILWWFIIAPAASALTTGTPHAVRALLFIPTYQVFISLGIWQVLYYLQITKGYKIKLWAILTITALYTVSIYYYLDMYYVHGPYEQAQSWQYGYKQVVNLVNKIKENYNQVIITYAYDQPYIYFLFYEKTDPAWYQSNWQGGEIKRSERNYGKYTFRDIIWEKDKELTNTLFVGTAGEIPQGAQGLIDEILFPNGEIAFRVIAR